MKENVIDAEIMTAQDAVRHPVSEEGVPVRNITFGDFLEDEASKLKEKMIQSIAFFTPPSNLLDELVYLRWRYFISDEDFLSELEMFIYATFDSESLSAFYEDFEEEYLQDDNWVDESITALSYLLTSLGSQRGVRKTMEKHNCFTVEKMWELNLDGSMGSDLYKIYLASCKECEACGQNLNVPHCNGNYYVVGFGMKVCSECYFEGRD